MPQWSKVVAPATKGLAQDFAAIGAPVEIPIEVHNGRFDKRGIISKRAGFQLRTMVDEDGNDIVGVRRLWSNGAQLCATTYRGLYELISANNTSTTWAERGEPSPFGGTTIERWKDSRSFDGCDVHASPSGPLTFCASALQIPKDDTYSTGPRVNRYVYGAVYGTDGQCLLPRQELSSGYRILDVRPTEPFPVSDISPHAPRAMTLSTKRCVAFLKNNDVLTTSDKGILEIWDADSSDLDAGFANRSTISPVFHDDFNVRTYDWAPYGTSQTVGATSYHLAYIPWSSASNRIVRVFRQTSTHTTSYSINLSQASMLALRVAIISDAVRGKVGVAVLWANSITAALSLSVYCLDDSGSALTQDSVVNTLDVGDSTDEWFDNFGWAEFGDRYVLTYAHYSTMSSPFAYTGITTEVLTCDDAFATFEGPTTLLYNAIPLTRPWTGFDPLDPSTPRIYLSAGSYNYDFNGQQNRYEYLFEVRGIFELRGIEAGGTHEARFCGRHNVGTDCAMWHSFINDGTNEFTGGAPWTLRQGSANTVSRPGGASVPTRERWSYHYAHCSRAEVADDSVALIWDRKYRMAANHTVLDVEARRTESAVVRGCSLLGGALPTWYDGAVLVEQGFSLPPIIRAAVVDTGGGHSAGDAADWVTVWSTHDERGLLHRSAPAPAHHGVTNAADAEFVYTRSNPLTLRREPLPLVTVQLYRTDENNVLRRVMHPTTQIPNAQYVGSLDSFLNRPAWDRYEEDDGTPLYTEGGIYEAIGLEGCDIVHVAMERVLAAGAFRRDVLYHSKRFPAATGGLAPEFHEAFTYVIPDGKAITGLSSMGDRAIVFTERGIYAISGQGPADDGSSNDFSGLVSVSATEGCADPRSVVSTVAGVFFWTGRTYAILTPSLQVMDVGAGITDLLAAYDTVCAAVYWPEEECVVIAMQDHDHTTGGMAAFYLRHNAWATWEPRTTINTIQIIESLAVHEGRLYAVNWGGDLYIAGPGYFYDGEPFGANTKFHVPLRVTSGWLQAAGFAGRQLVRNVTIYGERVTGHELTIRLYTDHNATYDSGRGYTIESGINETVTIKPGVQKCQAMKVQVYDSGPKVPNYGESYRLAGFVFEVAVVGALAKHGADRR